MNLDKDDVTEKIADMAKWLKVRKGIPSVEEEKFRRKVIQVIGEYCGDSAIGALVELLNEKAFFKGDLLKPTKKAALNALVMIGSEKALQSLRDAANHKDDFVAVTAEDILKSIDSKKP